MQIKIVNGTYGHRPVLANGSLSPYIVPVTPNSLPIEVEDEEARRLIDLGVAIKAESASPAPAKVSPNGNTEAKAQAQEAPTEAPETGYLDAEQLKEMSFDDLKALAKDMGVENVGKIRSKAGLIEAITALEVEAEPVLDVQDVIE